MPGDVAAREPGKPGAVRDATWNELARARAVGYPLPPHGHHPNFTGASQAAAQLMRHPRVASLRTLVIGPERALYAARKLALQAGQVIYVPDQRHAGRYYRLTGDPKGADLKVMPAAGEPAVTPEGAQAAILACVAVDVHGARLSKGFGWAARGLQLSIPEFTLAHPLMLHARLACDEDSRVTLIGTPTHVLEVNA